MAKQNVNSELLSEAREYNVRQAAATQDVDYCLNTTLLGEKEGQTLAGIKSLDATQFYQGSVTDGDAICEITNGVPNLTGQKDPNVLEIPYATATISANLNDSGFVSFDSAAGSFATSVSGGGTLSKVASIISLLTGLSSSIGFDKITSGGSLPSIQGVMDAAASKASTLVSDVTSSITDLGASVTELADVTKVAQSVNFGSISDITESISSVTSLNPSAGLRDVISNGSELVELGSIAKDPKNALTDTVGLSDVVGNSKTFTQLGQLTSEVTNLDLQSSIRADVGATSSGVLGNLAEKSTGDIKNFARGLTDNRAAFSGPAGKELVGQISRRGVGDVAKATKTVTADGTTDDRLASILNQITDDAASSTDALINEVRRIGRTQGYDSSEYEALVTEIRANEKAIVNYDATIAGSVEISAPIFDEPILLSDAENDWQGKASKNSVFTFVSSVEELEVEFNAIKREITEVVVHASETHSNKNIGSDDLHFVHNELGKDGIGYHYVIRRDGRLQRGRPVNKEGDHASVNGHDKRSIGLVLIGGLNVSTGQNDVANYRSSQSFTREQYTTLEIFLSKFYQKYPGGQVFGHNDIDINELDPYFDVVDYVESVFNKRNTTTDPLNKGPLKSSELV